MDLGAELPPPSRGLPHNQAGISPCTGAKIPQLPPNSKQLLAKKSGLTFQTASFLLRHN